MSQMSDNLPDLATCFTPEFLTGGMGDKTLFLNNYNHHHHIRYDFVSSSSTESDSEEDDDITGLTHLFSHSVSLQKRLKIPYPLEKKRFFSSSPESTLNWNVFRHSQARSLPKMPFRPAIEDSWGRIHDSGGHMTWMKTNAINEDVFAYRGLPGAPIAGANLSHHHFSNCAIRSENEEFIRQQQFHRRVAGDFGGQCACPFLKVENRRRQPHHVSAVKPVLGGITGGCGRAIAVVKKERPGTGVFLPRNYCNVPPESKIKPDGISQSFNKNMNPIIVPQQPNIHDGFTYLHLKRDELLMDKQTAVMLAQQRRSTAVAGVGETLTEVVLPQEWAY